jgi:hypothetical protein
MRYIVKSVEKGYEITHIEEKKTLTGETVEVIKGINVLQEDKILEAIEQVKEEIVKLKEVISEEEIAKRVADLKEQVEGDIDLKEEQIVQLNKFIEEINKIK